MKLTREQYTKLDELIREEIEEDTKIQMSGMKFDPSPNRNYSLPEISNKAIDRMIKNIFRILGE